MSEKNYIRLKIVLAGNKPYKYLHVLNVDITLVLYSEALMGKYTLD